MEFGVFKLDATMQFVVELVVSLAIGILIGLEREHTKADDRGKFAVVGVRTFPLISLSGFLVAFLETTAKIPHMILAGVGVMGAFSVVFFYVRYERENKGVTTALSIFVTFIIGIVIGLGYIFFGLALGIVTTFLLASKHRLHSIAEVLTEDELLGALEFATLALILLPLTYQLTLPKPYGDYVGPGKPFDIFWIILIVVVVSLISLISFLAIRRFGAKRGLEFSGAMGGMINSEAAAASLSQIAKRNRCAVHPALMGIMLANTLMLLRNLVICVISDPSLAVLKVMLFPCILMAISCLVFTRSITPQEDTGEKIEMKNPFAILPALEFAMIFALIAAIVFGATTLPQIVGNKIASNMAIGFTALGGLVSSSAVVAPLSALAFSGHIAAEIAGIVATAACIVSTLNKILLTSLVSKEFSKKLYLPMGVTAAIGCLSLFFSWLIF